MLLKDDFMKNYLDQIRTGNIKFKNIDFKKSNCSVSQILTNYLVSDES